MLLLDSDLAELYGYELKNLNRQVKRNGRRFPEDFMFRLTQDELEQLRCQNVTTNPMSRSLPYVFTEQGIYMLATVLKGELAETNQKKFLHQGTDKNENTKSRRRGTVRFHPRKKENICHGERIRRV